MINISDSVLTTNENTKICPTCSAVIPYDAKECGECGEKFNIPAQEKEISKEVNIISETDASDKEMVDANIDDRRNGIIGAGILLMLIGFISGPIMIALYSLNAINILNINFRSDPVSLWLLFSLGTIVGFIGTAIVVVGLNGNKYIKEIIK